MRNDKDFYPTPNSAIMALLNNYELKPGWVLECCAGNGAICKAIREQSGWDSSMVAVEIRPEERETLEGYCDEVYISDFLNLSASDFKSAPTTIITNPPFSAAQEIIEKSFEIAAPYTEIIMLLRMGFLESQKRIAFWEKHPNVSLITLAERPSFTGSGTDATAYGWYIWNNERQFIKPCVR